MNTVPKKTIFSILTKPINALVAGIIAIISFTALYMIMAKLPGTNGYACIEGANLTTTNIIISGIIAIFTGMIIIGFKELIQQKRNNLHIGSTSGIALIFGSLTTVCTICTIPIISLFGVSISLQVFTTYNTLFKIITLALMATSLYLLNKNLMQECQICKIKNK